MRDLGLARLVGFLFGCRPGPDVVVIIAGALDGVIFTMEDFDAAGESMGDEMDGCVAS